MTREFPLPTGNYVVQDLQLFSEGHPVPMGYEIVSHTKNDGLLSLRKVNFCLKRAYREHIVSCVCDIIFVNLRKKEILPPHYVGIGEVNGLTVAVQFGGIPGALQRPPPIGQSVGLSKKSVLTSHAEGHNSSQTHEETAKGVDEMQYSIFQAYFYHGVPPRPDEDIARAEEIGKMQEQDDEGTAAVCLIPEGLDLFSRFQDKVADPESLPGIHYDEYQEEREEKHNRRDSFSSRRIYQSMRPISVVPLTAMIGIQFKVNPTTRVSSSIDHLLSSSDLDLLYVEHAEEVEEKFMYSFAVEREFLFKDTKPSASVDGECINIGGHSIVLPANQHKPRTQSPQHKRRNKSKSKTAKKDKHQVSEKLTEGD
ncbi:uncharacterized protein LOC134191279 isoform X2 [Corticium candelabrum]|nr:uncharacterized protein LOC134191279 isoform X2 [Corticium candelabrum]